MLSVKPGRGPSLMGGFAGVVAAVFGVIWILIAGAMGAPAIFRLFGVLFVILAIGNSVYHLINATHKNRMSTFDITTGREEQDPLSRLIRNSDTPEEDKDAPSRTGIGEAAATRKFPGQFCPFCGGEVRDDFEFCPNCGKDI